MTFCMQKYDFHWILVYTMKFREKKIGSSLDFGANYELLRKQNLAFNSILGYDTTFCVTKFAISLDFEL